MARAVTAYDVNISGRPLPRQPLEALAGAKGVPLPTRKDAYVQRWQRVGIHSMRRKRTLGSRADVTPGAHYATKKLKPLVKARREAAVPVRRNAAGTQQPIALPALRCLPARVRGTPILRDSFPLAADSPDALFHENPGIPFLRPIVHLLYLVATPPANSDAPVQLNDL